MRITALALSLACGMAALSTVSAQPAPTADIVLRGLTKEEFPRIRAIVPDVYVYEELLTADGTSFTTNSLIIVTAGGVVVVDGQAKPAQVESMIERIKKLTTQPIKYVVVASDHGDHVAGNAAFKSAFPDVVFISSPVSQSVVARNTALPPVTEVVADKRVLSMGGTQIEILNLGRGHTGGDLTVYLPESKVLFLGELYLRHLFPSMVSGYPTEWAATLSKAEALDATWYIPGHGFTDDAASMKSGVKEARMIIKRIMAEAKRLKAAGYTCESPKNCEAAPHAQWGRYVNLTAFDPQASRALARAYMELDGKLPD